MLKPLFFYTGLLLFLVACQSGEDTYLTLDGKAQGTTFHIVYEDPAGRDFSLAVDSLLKLMDKSMSLWVKESVINSVNANVDNVILDEHFIRVFNEAQKISAATEGVFDVTIRPLINAWKIDDGNHDALPDAADIDSILSFTGFRNVTIDYAMIRKKDPRTELDFNAIAQGYTVDLISEFLEKTDIKNYLVEVGGEVRAKGVNNRNKYWQVGIDKPVKQDARGRALQTTIPLRNKSLATSGNYRKFKEIDGKKYSHVIDPATGYPANHNLLSVSVLDEDCARADGYATAFLIMGLEQTIRFATDNKIPVYCIYADEDGNFAIESTPGFPK